MLDFPKILKQAIQEKLIKEEEDRLVFVYDLDFLKNKFKLIQSSFPNNSQHTIPVKTAPLMGLLKFAVLNGMGLECASEIEFEMALQAEAQVIVLNAPIKTPRLIKRLAMCKQQIYINVNDLKEIEKYEEVYKKHIISIRINPLVEVNTANYLQTANADSKFGELITHESSIIQALYQFPFVQGLHVHTGSNFTDFSPTIEGIKKVYVLAEKINQTFQKKVIRMLNIGGGLSANCDLIQFSETLFKHLPSLKEGNYNLITEYGRFVYQHAAFSASVIELIKNQGDKKIILCHFGGHVFVREIYTNERYKDKISILQQSTNHLSNQLETYAIAGPLCYGGDFLIDHIMLPELNENDWLIAEKTGGNTLGLFSKHCSQNFPKVLAYALREDFTLEIKVLKDLESVEEVINFWC